MNEAAVFIRGLELPSAPPVRRGGEAIVPAFTADPQAFVVNAQMAEFDAKVPEPLRPTISNAILLAQLAADKEAGTSDPWTWYGAYKSVLGKIGWVSTVDETSQQEVSDRSSELHKAIIPILEAALGPAAAGSIILEVLKGLGSMSENAPWMSLFQRKSQSANAAKFGLSYVGFGDDGGALLKTVFFGIDATQTLTQVLFVKLAAANAMVRSAQSQFVASGQSLNDTAGILGQKVQPYIIDNIKNIAI
jgi:hypothetical protein